MRLARVLAAAAAVAVLTGVFACTREPAPSAAGATGTPGTPVPPATPAGGSGVASGPVAPAPSGTGTSRSTPVTFTVTETRPAAACGISIRAHFIPPSASGQSQLQAYLVGQALGVPGGVPGGDQPVPGAVAPARPGTVATVLGRRFG
ncbi:MAG: hypothetical protein J2P15_23930, partial [Micromonosporaceae bacterium]|nr:hypothetical protein [Micromonosporaceae bacterium]